MLLLCIHGFLLTWVEGKGDGEVGWFSWTAWSFVHANPSDLRSCWGMIGRNCTLMLLHPSIQAFYYMCHLTPSGLASVRPLLGQALLRI